MNGLEFLRSIEARFDDSMPVQLTAEEALRLERLTKYVDKDGMPLSLDRSWRKPIRARIWVFEHALAETVANRLDAVPWVTQKGEKLHLRDMDDSHLRNLIRMIAEDRAPLARAGHSVKDWWMPRLMNEHLARLTQSQDERS